MHKDPTEFRKRFAKWKEGGKPYKDGKISDEQYVSIMENVAADNWLQWGDESEDAALTRILNDNAYDYRGYYNDNPGSAANADTHWPDKYKTVWHPTFSNQSKYSGKKSQYNPHGYPGGTWQGELFNPQWYQQHLGTGFYKDGYPKLPKFEGGEEKFKLKKTPEFVQAGKDNSWSKVTNDDMGAVFQEVVARPSRTGGNTTAGNWKKLWEPKLEKGLEVVSPEFDIISGIRGIIGMLPKKAATITSKNAAKITPELWTAAQDAAIARGDMTEAQRLRDLHFKVSTPGNVVTKEGMPIHNYHGTKTNFNEFDLKYFGQHDPGDRGYGFYFSQNHDVASDYGSVINDYYLNATTPYTGKDWYSKYINRGDKENIVKQISKKIDEEDALKIERLKEKYPGLDDNLIRNAVSRSSSSERENIINNLGNIENTDIYLSPYENVVYKPNQIKLADAVTYDNKGIRIPLGERDNFNISDIRYGIIPLISGSTGYSLFNKYAE